MRVAYNEPITQAPRGLQDVLELGVETIFDLPTKNPDRILLAPPVAQIDCIGSCFGDFSVKGSHPRDTKDLVPAVLLFAAAHQELGLGPGQLLELIESRLKLGARYRSRGVRVRRSTGTRRSARNIDWR
jgi:hypothetical protein